MYQLEVSKFAAAHWQDIAMGAIILVAAIGGVAQHSLTNCLKRHDASTWEALGRPQLFSGKSTKEDLTYLWYILARQYRKSEIRKIRALGDLSFVCFTAMWILALAVITFGDLNRYNFHWTFEK
jgi:hypothetical protein